MPPYEVRVKAVFRNGQVVPIEPVSFREGEEIEIVSRWEMAPVDISSEDQRRGLQSLDGTFRLPADFDPKKLDTSRNHPEMYRD